ncbi:hypothetical protein BKA62DRAFT_131990 [Auriculariales sp. MPI-PUGE-AT-0066]|nr:hypothetical protein BKA62DRAFT_131990 [Auriculariales sp. MPI-PUGE-AT-0066]
MATNPVSSKLVELAPALSPGARLLADNQDPAFTKLTHGWSNLNTQVPAAILLPAVDEDVAAFVRFATANGIPFVPRSGGHGNTSSIDSRGVLLDLQQLDQVKVDKERATVTFQSGVLSRALLKACHDAGFVVPVGNCNGVGVVPFILGGGFTKLEGLLGPACDSILECKVVLASGEIITVSETQHADLFWAMRGAGLYFGVTLELTVKLQSFSLINRDDGMAWEGTLLFDPSQDTAVFSAWERLLADNDANACGLIVMCCPPPAFQPILMAALVYLGDSKSAEHAYSELLSLPRLATQTIELPFASINNSADMFCVKGDFKAISGVALRRIDVVALRKSFAHYTAFVKAYPDAIMTCIGLRLQGRHPKLHPDNAFRHRDVLTWSEVIPWWKDAQINDAIQAFMEEQNQILRHDQGGVLAYDNFSRAMPAECRYPGDGVLARLHALKTDYDPTGVFTRQFL